MDRFTGILGIVLLLGIAYLMSENRKAISGRLVLVGLMLQLLLAVLILKVQWITRFFSILGSGMSKLEQFATKGAEFVFGGLMVGHAANQSTPYGSPQTFVFAFSVTATIILVCVLVALCYQLGVLQGVVLVLAKSMNRLMRVSGSEALSNVASAFVGQVEAQVMIRPYLKGMTRSEMLSSMTGSMACIAGGILIVYVNMGAKAEYLLAASIMAAPGALVISKILIPETEVSETSGKVRLQVHKPYANSIDAISHGAAEGMKIALNVIAMLIGFIALISLVNYGLGWLGKIGNWYPQLSLDTLFGALFYPIAWCMGANGSDTLPVAMLMGQKLSINEFVAFDTLTHKLTHPLSEKANAIASFAICGFANFASVGMQIGGIGTLVPEKRSQLAKLGLKALLGGTLASYLSAAIAGILMG